MSRIVLVNRFFWPETPATGQLLTDLAVSLAQAGADVVVVTSGESGRHAATEIHQGIRIIRVLAGHRTHHSVPRKAAAFIHFLFGAGRRLAAETRRGDTVVALTDPPLIGFVAALVAKLRGARLVHWAQDIYPEVAIAVTHQRWLRVFAPIRNWAWRSADVCVTLGEEMAAVVRAAANARPTIQVIPNWAPEGLAPVAADAAEVLMLRRLWGLDRRFVVAYSGNLGRVHHLDPLLAAATELRDQSNIAFLFIGGGPQLEAIQRKVAELRLANVQFQPTQPREEFGTSLAVADIHVVTLREGCQHFVFPSKFYGIARVGRPVLFIGPSGCELARLIEQMKIGRAVDSAVPRQVADAIRQLATDQVRCERLAAASAEFGARHTAQRALAMWHRVLIDERLPRAIEPASSAS